MLVYLCYHAHRKSKNFHASPLLNKNYLTNKLILQYLKTRRCKILYLVYRIIEETAYTQVSTMRMETYATPTKDIDYSCYVYKSHRTYLTNHMGSIPRHIKPLVINSLGGRHTHINTHTHTHTHKLTEIRGQKQL